jgi:hypothetical protein
MVDELDGQAHGGGGGGRGSESGHRFREATLSMLNTPKEKKTKCKRSPSQNKAAMDVRRPVAVSPESTSNRSPFCRAVNGALAGHVIAMVILSAYLRIELWEV